MSGERIVDEVEGRAAALPTAGAVERQAEAQQRIDEPLLGALELAPGQHVGRIGEIGNGAVELAGGAELRAAIGAHEPVAHAVRVIGAIAQPCARALLVFAIEAVAGRNERADFESVGAEAECVPAAQALHVLEVDGVAARPAFERLHRALDPAVASRRETPQQRRTVPLMFDCPILLQRAYLPGNARTSCAAKDVLWSRAALHKGALLASGSDDPSRRSHAPDRLPLRPRDRDGAAGDPAAAGAALPHADPQLFAEHRAEAAFPQLAAGPVRQLLRARGAAGEDRPLRRHGRPRRRHGGDQSVRLLRRGERQGLAVRLRARRSRRSSARTWSRCRPGPLLKKFLASIPTKTGKSRSTSSPTSTAGCATR